jgi:hypothetical protein
VENGPNLIPRSTGFDEWQMDAEFEFYKGFVAQYARIGNFISKREGQAV